VQKGCKSGAKVVQKWCKNALPSHTGKQTRFWPDFVFSFHVNMPICLKSAWLSPDSRIFWILGSKCLKWAFSSKKTHFRGAKGVQKWCKSGAKVVQKGAKII